MFKMSDLEIIVNGFGSVLIYIKYLMGKLKQIVLLASFLQFII